MLFSDGYVPSSLKYDALAAEVDSPRVSLGTLNCIHRFDSLTIKKTESRSVLSQSPGMKDGIHAISSTRPKITSNEKLFALMRDSMKSDTFWRRAGMDMILSWAFLPISFS